jgi:hypothetical protein
MSILRTRWAVTVVGSWLLLPRISATAADALAVTNGAPFAGGYAFGAPGFTFTPKTNLTVTSVGYWNSGLSSPVIRFWADTNIPMATFQLAASPSVNAMVYSNATLTLLGGHRYSITLQEGLVLANSFMLLNYFETPDFRPASVLTNYTATFINPSGVFTNGTSNSFLSGPNFTFQTGAATPLAPPLNIAANGPSEAVLSWPDAPGFVLQHRVAFTETNWAFAPLAVVASGGTNRATLTPLPDSGYFRLIYP